MGQGVDVTLVVVLVTVLLTVLVNALVKVVVEVTGGLVKVTVLVDVTGGRVEVTTLVVVMDGQSWSSREYKKTCYYCLIAVKILTKCEVKWWRLVTKASTI